MVFDADPTAVVEYDHSNLEALLEKYDFPVDSASELQSGIAIAGNKGYEQLPDVPDEDGFRHVGWIVNGVQYPADNDFVSKRSHAAKSVWVGLPAVTYDHSQLVEATGDPGSRSGLNNGLEIEGNDGYEQLPNRDGYTHVGWMIGDVKVGPTDPFVTLRSHVAVSLWSAIPTVIFSHSNLKEIVGTEAEGISELATSMIIEGHPNYPQLPETAGYKHVGWDIGGTIVNPTAELLYDTTHTAKSVWEKKSDSARPIPIIPDEEEPIEVIVEKDSEPWLGKNGKSVLLIAVIVAIIAELAVLTISRKR